MNGIERIKAAISFQKQDHVPVMPQVFGHAAILSAVTLDDYIRDGDLLARCQLNAQEFYGYDAVFALMDVYVESEAMGSVLVYQADRYPTVKAYAADVSGLNNLTVPDPYRDGRMPELIKAAAYLRREVGNNVLVVGCVLGPMTLAVQLLGMEKAIYLAIDEPEQFTRLLDFATSVIIRFGSAQLEAGVHLPVVFDPASSPDVIPPQFFREFILPRLKQVFESFKQAGSAVNWLHTTGPVEPILPFYTQAGVELFNIDYCVSPLNAMQALPQTCLNGNIKPVSFIEKTPAEIKAESSNLIDLFAKRGGFILSSGCEIPPESKPENIAAMVSAARGDGEQCQR